MRYFFSLQLPKTLLPFGISLVTLGADLVSMLGLVLPFVTRRVGTISTAIPLTPIAITTNLYLAMAAETIEASGTGKHWQKGR